MSKILKYCLCALIAALFSCSSFDNLTKKELRTLNDSIELSPVLSKSFTGFALFDPEKKEFVYQKNADKHFTPASNTKIFTFYTALKVLGDSLPLLHYKEVDDTLIFWGAGNPMLLHPSFDNISDPVIDFLKSSDKRLYLSEHHNYEDHFGPGWAWDDFNYAYQPKKSAMPLYGNVVYFQNTGLGLEAYPSYFQDFSLVDREMGGSRPTVKRELSTNIFNYNNAAKQRKFERQVPFDYNPETVISLLMDTLKKEIHIWDKAFQTNDFKTIKMATPDTLYQKLMKDSDNFIAEQLLLMCSDELFDKLDSRAVIRAAKSDLFDDFEDELAWVDGSGLSRYNMFTPRTIVKLLTRIHEEVPKERWMNIFPAGGSSGTIEKFYKEEPPFIYAKTGTLSGKHCLSGFLLTDSGKTLIFSFMHNNFISSSNPLKGEMDKVLRWIKERY